MNHIISKGLSVLTLFTLTAQATAPLSTHGTWKPVQVLCNGANSTATNMVQSARITIDPSQMVIANPMPASEGRQCRGSISLQVMGDDANTLQLGNGQFSIECLVNNQWSPINSGPLTGQKQYLLHIDAVDAGSLTLSSQVEQGSAFADCKAGQTATLILKRD